MLRFPTLAAFAVAASVGLAVPAGAQDRPEPPRSSPESERPRASGRDGYVLSLHGDWLSSDLSFGELSRAEHGGDHLWFRRSGKTYVIDDPAALARAAALFDPLRALEPEQEALRDRERALDHRENALDAEEERIDAAMERLEPDDADAGDGDENDDEYVAAAPAAPSPEDERERGELERRRGDLRERQRELQADQRAFERDERALDQREEKLEAEAESQLWRLMDEAIASGVAKPADGR
jgi:hypothetical protein